MSSLSFKSLFYYFIREASQRFKHTFIKRLFNIFFNLIQNNDEKVTMEDIFSKWLS
ncbi:uncharacterized protein MP3633_3657 [Marinomonas primoryensis]|uniref:Uncharacterized protein n=1 Tax=Marinomonas primoryensis TaxID=178399 RepID=A0A859D0S1_9GAMM|nr:uncharacterized protein MP3633_3657 [Marinomonas primoryensis]